MFSNRGVCGSCRANISKRLQQQFDGPLNRHASRNLSSFSSKSKLTADSHSHINYTFRTTRTSPLTASRISIPARAARSSAFIIQARFASTRNPPSVLPESPPDLAGSSPNVVDPAANLPTNWGENFGEQLPLEHWDIGYLKSQGIEFGWLGLSRSISWLFEHLHVYFSIPSGISIGGSIVITAIVMRTIVFPFILMAGEQSARLQALSSVTAPLQQKLKEARGTGDSQKLAKLSGEYRQVLKQSNIQLWKMGLPFLQLPVGFCAWRVVRNMCDVPVEGITTGGWLWFKNLAVADPYTGLPLIMAGFQFMAIRMGGDTGSQTTQTKQIRRFMQYGLPLIGYIVVMWAPAGIQLSFCSASVLALCTATLMRSPGFRRFFKLSPLVKGPSKVTPPGYRGTITVDARAAAPGAAAAASPTEPISLIGKARKKMTDAVSDVLPEAMKEKGASQKKQIKDRAKQYEKKREKELLDEQRRYREAQDRRFRERK